MGHISQGMGDELIIWEKATKGQGHFLRGVLIPLKIRCEDFHFAGGVRLDWVKWLKMGMERFHFSCNFYSCAISSLVKILLLN